MKRTKKPAPKRREIVENATNREQIQVRAVGSEQCRYAQGLHFRGDMSAWEFQDALDTCERDGFRDIWVHYPNVVNLAHVVRREVRE